MLCSTERAGVCGCGTGRATDTGDQREGAGSVRPASLGTSSTSDRKDRGHKQGALDGDHQHQFASNSAIDIERGRTLPFRTGVMVYLQFCTTLPPSASNSVVKAS